MNGVDKDVWIQQYNSETDQFAYVDTKGKVKIPFGKYAICYTDTFRHYAIVLDRQKGFIGIDKEQNVLFEVYPFDNGPDDPVEGLFRIMVDGKIGFADVASGELIIPPRFGCAFQFELGKAKVTDTCTIIRDGEYSNPQSNSWYYIDREGNRVH